VARSERGDGSPAPEVVTKSASSGKALVAAAESSIGSLSSASRLQQEWADTASSAGVGEKLKVQGSKPTLAELDKQFTAARGLLQNAGLQLLDAIQATNVSAAPFSPWFLLLYLLAPSFEVAVGTAGLKVDFAKSRRLSLFRRN
jgi:hypothetical protein